MPDHREDKRRDPDFREFVRWCALPKRVRKQQDHLADTQKEWAEKHDYSPGALTQWKKREEYDELMEELTQQWIKDSIPQVVQTAREVATRDDPSGYKDRELLMEMAGQVGHHMTVEHQGEVEHTLTLEDARTMGESDLRKAMRTQLRQNPKFADASDDRLDDLIDAFVAASGSEDAPDALPQAGGEEAVQDAEYVIADSPPDM